MVGDNKLTFDPPTHSSELTQNLIRLSHGHSTPSLKISCKSVQPFSCNVADKERNKQTKKQTKISSENNTPSPYRGRVIININVKTAAAAAATATTAATKTTTTITTTVNNNNNLFTLCLTSQIFHIPNYSRLGHVPQKWTISKQEF